MYLSFFMMACGVLTFRYGQEVVSILVNYLILSSMDPYFIPYGPQREKTCFLVFANNKSADQSAHPRRLISAFVIRFLESIISRLVTSEISMQRKIANFMHQPFATMWPLLGLGKPSLGWA